MAVKDHSLDLKIIESAKNEFLQYGFQKASLHKIASQAGITTGALYTRYKNKDALFCSLVQDMFQSMQEKAAPVRDLYYTVMKNRDITLFLEAMHDEMRIYLDVLFEHYDSCILFFCKSGGSSLEKLLREMMESKAKETVQFLSTISDHEIDQDGIELIMANQFHFYKMVLEKKYTREKAASCLKTYEIFAEAGWKNIFTQVIR